MLNNLRTILLSALCFLTFTVSVQTHASEDKNPPIVVSASSYSDSTNGKYIAISFQNQEGWHTYWQNPGDVGTAISSHFYINNMDEVDILPLEWPAPMRYIEGGSVWVYGQGGTYTLFYPLTKKTLKRFGDSEVKIKTNILACKNICVPVESSISGTFISGKFEANSDQEFQITEDVLAEHFNKIPKSDNGNNIDISISLNDKKDGFSIFYSIYKYKKEFIPYKRNVLTPYSIEPFIFHHEELYKDSKNNIYGKINVSWDGEYLEPPLPLPLSGNFNKNYTFKFSFHDPNTGVPVVINKKFSTFNTSGPTQLFQHLEKLNLTDNKNTLHCESQDCGKKEIYTDDSGKDGYGILYYIIMAFIGGIILNFMPCVLPVISIKLFGLIKHKHSTQSEIIKHNFFYTLGVLSTFSALGIAITLLKLGGETIGWGFQLQSPIFVASMIIFLLVFTLNMFGLFEFMTPGGKSLGNIKISKNFFGDFVSGVLATVLSTPCSAPFLGTALTFAFISSTTTIMLIFTSIGLGLSFPFIMTGIFPKLLIFLPRPGEWMNHLKKFLGLTLLITIVWLMDVFINITSLPTSFLKLNIGLILIFFTIYYYHHVSKKVIALIILTTISIAPLVSLVVEENKSSNQDNIETITADVKWTKWSPANMRKLTENNEDAIINFTAKWCLTCKVNHRLVFDTDDFNSFVKNNNIKLLSADWTKRDPIISKWLKKHNMVGVPAYFILKKDGSLIKLGETISMDKIKKYLPSKE